MDDNPVITILVAEVLSDGRTRRGSSRLPTVGYTRKRIIRCGHVVPSAQRNPMFRTLAR
jgi:hypothetical protein